MDYSLLGRGNYFNHVEGTSWFLHKLHIVGTTNYFVPLFVGGQKQGNMLFFLVNQSDHDDIS
jgi:hypothetical protein